jgi:hypothetical protein
VRLSDQCSSCVSDNAGIAVDEPLSKNDLGTKVAHHDVTEHIADIDECQLLNKYPVNVGQEG